MEERTNAGYAEFIGWLETMLLNPNSRQGGSSACCLPGKSPKMEFNGKERNLLFNSKFLLKISGEQK